MSNKACSGRNKTSKLINPGQTARFPVKWFKHEKLMKPFIASFCLLAFGAMYLASTAGYSQIIPSGPLLATAQVKNGIVGLPSIRTSMTVSLGLGLNTNAVLFNQFVLTPSDAGRTFTLDSSNDPDFAAAKLSLENGLTNRVVFRDGLGSTLLVNEPVFFSTLPLGGNGFDLQGFSVGSISMTVDSLTLTTPGTNPTGSGIWTDVFFRATISFYAVPEPSGIVLLGVTGIVLSSRFFRCKTKQAAD
jgi:hypothetical protein